MAMLQIDGVGTVEVGPEFARLPVEQQNATVQEIVATIRGGAAPAAPPAAAPPQVPSEGGFSEPPPAAPPPEPGAAAAAGRVVSRAAEAGAERFGERPLGLSDQTIQELRDKGALAAEGAAPTPIQLLNAVVYQFGAKAGDAILRSIGAGIGALGGAAEQTAVELGENPSMARRLGRDVGGLTESALTVAGQPAALAQSAAVRAAAPVRAAIAEESVAARAAGPQIAPGATAAEVRAGAKSIYQKADDAGVVIKPESYKTLSDDIFSAASKGGMDKTLTPNSMAAVARIEELAKPNTGPISFQTLDLMRQIASDAKGGAKASDRRVATIITDKIDDYIAALGSKDVVTGNAKAAAEAIVQARDLWSRAAKLETVETLVQRAADSAKTFSGSGFENALRTEFKALAKNKRLMRTFTPEEQAAIRQVNRGTIPANFARGAGKLAARGPVSAFTSGGIGATIGSALLGPGLGTAVGGATAFGIGEVGRKVATVLAQRSIRRLEDVIRKGESPLATSAITRGNALLGLLAGAAAPAAIGESQRQ